MTKAHDALALGHLGEKYVYGLFERAGRKPVFGPPGDIRLDGGSGVSIEVKASLPNAGRNRYQFCLYREGKTDAKKSDLTILLAFTSVDARPVLLAIPRARLNGAKSIKLPANLGGYTGKWSWFFGFDRAIVEIERVMS